MSSFCRGIPYGCYIDGDGDMSDLSREAEMALTTRWQAVVGDEFDIVVSIRTFIFSCLQYVIYFAKCLASFQQPASCQLVFWCKNVNHLGEQNNSTAACTT